MFLFLLPYFPHFFLKIVASRLTVYKKARKTAYKMIANPVHPGILCGCIVTTSFY